MIFLEKRGEAIVSQAQEHVLSLLQSESPPDAITRLNALDVAAWQQVIGAAESLGVAPLLMGRAAGLNVSPPEAIQKQLTQILQSHTARAICDCCTSTATCPARSIRAELFSCR